MLVLIVDQLFSVRWNKNNLSSHNFSYFHYYLILSDKVSSFVCRGIFRTPPNNWQIFANSGRSAMLLESRFTKLMQTSNPSEITSPVDYVNFFYFVLRSYPLSEHQVWIIVLFKRKKLVHLSMAKRELFWLLSSP